MGVLAVLMVAELGARWVAPALAEPLRWNDTITHGKALQIATLAAAGESVDVVIAGTSQAMYGIDPASVEAASGGTVRAYNAALYGVTPRAQREWLLDVVIPKLRPTTVVLGVNTYEFNDRSVGGGQFDDLWAAAPATRYDLLGRLQRRLERASALLQWRAALRRPGEVAAATGRRVRGEPGPSPTIAERDRFSERGFGLELRDASFRMTDATKRQIVRHLLEDWTAGGRRYEELSSLVLAVQQRGVRVVLVEMPVTADYVALHPRGTEDYNRFRSLLAELARGHGVPLLVNDSAFFDPRWFADPTHLNGRGSVMLSAAIASVLMGAGPAGDTLVALRPDGTTERLDPDITALALGPDTMSTDAVSTDAVSVPPVVAAPVPTPAPSPAVDPPGIDDVQDVVDDEAGGAPDLPVLGPLPALGPNAIAR